MNSLDTIVALSTARQMAAIAVVRLSGSSSLKILSNMVKKDVSKMEASHCCLCDVYRNKNDYSTLIDHAIVTVFKAPKSYTGEDLVEFSLHGSVAVADEVIQACISYGARFARPGEFSFKAANNGKMSILEAEGINDFIKANSKAGRKLALSSLKGDSTKETERIAEDLLEAISEAEYVLEDDLTDHGDFLERMKETSGQRVKQILSSSQKFLQKAVNGQRIYDGIDVAIVGRPNVGKSSLLNALLEEDKAIVTPIPGTTRDTVEGRMEIDGIQFRFIDTAGIRETQDTVEAIGVEKALKALRNCDIALLVSDDPDFALSPEAEEALQGKKIIKVGSKRDIKEVEGADVEISAAKGDLDELKKALVEGAGVSKAREEACFLSERDISFLTEFNQELEEALRALFTDGYVDAYSDMLRRGIDTINSMLGKSVGQTAEDIYQTIFSKFCMGK